MSLQSAVLNTGYLRLAFSVSVVPIGMITNTLATFIFCRKSLNTKESKNGFMNAFLCLFNMMALSNSILFAQTLPYFGISLLSASDAACRILYVWVRIWTQAPSWHQCLVSFLFYLSVKYPTKSKFMYKNIFIAKSMTIMMVLMLLVNMLNFWFYLDGYYMTVSSFNVTSNQTINQTVFVPTACNANSQLIMASDFINILMRCFIPFVVLTILTCLILYHVARVRRNISDPSHTNTIKRSTKNEVRFGRILIFLNFLFLILYLPWAMSFIVSYSISSRAVRLTTTGGSSDPKILYFYNVALCLSYTFNASPFFVNLIFNKLFQREFVNTFCTSKLAIAKSVS